jgi:hypothetical protein
MTRSILNIELVLDDDDVDCCKKKITSNASFFYPGKIKEINVSKYSPCPYNKIKDLYNKIFEGEKVRFCDGLSTNRKKALKARWNQCGDFSCGDLDWWRNYFSHIKKSPFLMGNVSNPGRAPFKLSFDWVINEQNMVNIYEGKYHRKLN